MNFGELKKKISETVGSSPEYWSWIFTTLTVSMCSMMIGFVTGYTSPALMSMATSENYLPLSREEQSLVGSLMPLFALFGAMIGGPLMDLLGRKIAIIGTVAPFIASWLLIAFASGVEMVYAGRCISGFCVGVASLCIPVYLGETVQPEVRGRLELMASTIGNAGILLSFIGGKFMDWSKLALVGSIVPVFIFVCMLLIPETPRWYISKNKVSEARAALEWLRSKEAIIDLELNNIRESHSQSVKNTGNSWDLFKKQNLKLLTISIGLMFFEQMSGIDAVIYYTALIFKASGSTIDDNVSTIIVGIVNCTSTLVATFLIDNLGRKMLLYISSAIMTVSLSVLGTFFYMKDSGYDVTLYGAIPLTSFVFFVVGFSLGMGPVPWLMLGEILPAKIRGPAASVVTVCTWTFAFIVTNSFLHVIKLLGISGTFWMFAIICLVSMVFVFFNVPETKGQSLEDIEEKLTRKSNTIYSRASSILQERL